MKSLKALRAFFAYDDPAVRVAALGALAEAAPSNSQQEIAAAINGSSVELRRAGADALWLAIESSRPQNGYVNRPAFLGLFGGGMVKIDPNQWLDDFRAGKDARPGWKS